MIRGFAVVAIAAVLAVAVSPSGGKASATKWKPIVLKQGFTPQGSKPVARYHMEMAWPSKSSVGRHKGPTGWSSFYRSF